MCWAAEGALRTGVKALASPDDTWAGLGSSVLFFFPFFSFLFFSFLFSSLPFLSLLFSSLPPSFPPLSFFPSLPYILLFLRKFSSQNRFFQHSFYAFLRMRTLWSRKEPPGPSSSGSPSLRGGDLGGEDAAFPEATQVVTKLRLKCKAPGHA